MGVCCFQGTLKKQRKTERNFGGSGSPKKRHTQIEDALLPWPRCDFLLDQICADRHQLVGGTGFISAQDFGHPQYDMAMNLSGEHPNEGLVNLHQTDGHQQNPN